MVLGVTQLYTTLESLDRLKNFAIFFQEVVERRFAKDLCLMKVKLFMHMLSECCCRPWQDGDYGKQGKGTVT